MGEVRVDGAVVSCEDGGAWISAFYVFLYFFMSYLTTSSGVTFVMREAAAFIAS